jgi:hypothetical protein
MVSWAMATSARIALFGVLSGLLWSAAPSCFIGTRSVGVFLLYALAAIFSGVAVSFSLYRPLLRCGRWVSLVLGVVALPLGAFCFGFALALLGMATGDLAGRATVASPFYSGIFFAYMTAVCSCLSWWGFILVPSSLLTTWLLRLTILRRTNSRKPSL